MAAGHQTVDTASKYQRLLGFLNWPQTLKCVSGCLNLHWENSQSKAWELMKVSECHDPNVSYFGSFLSHVSFAASCFTLLSLLLSLFPTWLFHTWFPCWRLHLLFLLESLAQLVFPFLLTGSSSVSLFLLLSVFVPSCKSVRQSLLVVLSALYLWVSVWILLHFTACPRFFTLWLSCVLGPNVKNLKPWTESVHAVSSAPF